MKKFKLNSLTSIVITMAIMLSCGGYLIADDAEQPEVTEETAVEQVQEPASDEEEPVLEETVDEDTIVVEEGETSEVVETSEGEYTITVEEVAYDESGYDSDYLSEQYIAQQMSVGPQVCYSIYNPQSNLTPEGVIVYNYLRTEVGKIASGSRSDAEIVIPQETSEGGLTISFTGDELNLTLDDLNVPNKVENTVAAHMPFNSDSIMPAMLNGSPYELYWFDKSSTGGLRMTYTIEISLYGSTLFFEITDLTFHFSVANEFQKGSRYVMDTTYGASAASAAANARAIITANENLSDYNKLLAYNDAICSLVSYNTAAAGGGALYGNPWQMIWVFDDNPNNQVVCEGYSKAFQFLCDHSTFNDPQLYVISVSGTAHFTSNEGPHMWNIVHMNDGFNYLIDVTNNDTLGNILFMVGAPTGSVSQGYTLSNGFRYVYDANTKVDFTTSALTLPAFDYDSSATGTPEFRGHAMQLSGQIGLQYVVELPANTDASQYYIAFTDEHGRTYTSDDLHNYSTNPNYYYAQVNISSILMAENITPTLYLRNAEGDDSVVLVGTPYSARDYINWGLANLSTSSREYKIIKALADYGHYSQIYLAAQNGWVNDGSVYTRMITYCTESFDYDTVSSAAAGQQIAISIAGTDFTRVTYSLRFGDTISLRVYLAADDYDSIDVSRLTFTGGVTPVVGRDANNRITITFNDIPATALTNRYTISYNSTEIVSVSPMSYVYGMLNTTGTSDAGRDLVCALYYYAQACAVNN